jgi:hypothetical protein
LIQGGSVKTLFVDLRVRAKTGSQFLVVRRPTDKGLKTQE